MQLLLSLPFFLFALLSTTYASPADISALDSVFESPQEVPPLPIIPPQLTEAAHAASSVAAVAATEASLVAYQNSIGISSGTPNNSLPNPCDPANQVAAPANSVSTYKESVAITSIAFTNASTYGVSYHYCNTSSSLQVPNITTCENEMISLCYKMAGVYDTPATNDWVFNNAGGNCTLEFWMPKGGASPPSYARCVNQIFLLIANTCLEPKYNLGTVNIAKVPDIQAFNSSAKSGTCSTGFAIDADYPSYIMLAQQSTDVNDWSGLGHPRENVDWQRTIDSAGFMNILL